MDSDSFTTLDFTNGYDVGSDPNDIHIHQDIHDPSTTSNATASNATASNATASDPNDIHTHQDTHDPSTTYNTTASNDTTTFNIEIPNITEEPKLKLTTISLLIQKLKGGLLFLLAAATTAFLFISAQAVASSVG